MTDVWMQDGYGDKALVPQDAVDQWKPRGWVEADEPADGDRVWMRHEQHGGKQVFPAGIAQTWQAMGWQPSEPPEPRDVTKDPALVDVAPPRRTPVPQIAERTDARSETAPAKTTPPARPRTQE